MRKFYNNKVVYSGDIIEVYEYEKSVVLGETNSRVGRSVEANEEDKIRHRKNTLDRARKNVRRIINANVKRWGERAKFLTLTFNEHITEIEKANYEFKKFRQRLEYELGIKLKYLAVIEFQKSGRIHYHVVFFNLPFIRANDLASIWGNGFIKINEISHVDNIGAYVTKYMTKDHDDERLKGKKSYFMSRGLYKPIEKYLNEKEIADLKGSLSHKEVYKNVFQNEYMGNILYTQYNMNSKGE